MNDTQFTQAVQAKVMTLGGFEPNVPQWVIAYSGGVDSRVLLHVLSELKPSDKELVVVHVNHGLSQYALDWEKSAEQVCSQYGIKPVISKVVLGDGASIEKQARDARYNAIESIMKPNAIVFMGHHLNDNAETFLFRLFRGTGINGLTGIPEKRTFGNGFIVRPFMDITRKDIESFAERNHFEWVTDDSNVDTKYSRNYIRHDILPVVTNKWGNFLQVLNRTIQQFKETKTLLDEIADSDWELVKDTHKKHQSATCFNIEQIKKLSNPRIKNVLLRFCSELGENNQSSASLDNLMKMIFSENKNNSKLKTVHYGTMKVVSNGKLVWIEKA